MIMQESLMREAMMKIGAFSINDLIQIVVENVSAGESSFCIEYELYAQFLISHRSDRIFFDKWSNIGVPRSRILGLHLEEIKKLYPDYFSLSAHDYISQSSKAF
jgi:hypothetical protein